MMLTYHISHEKKFSTALSVPGRSRVKHRAFLGGFGGMPPPPEKFFLNDAFWCIFRSDFVFKKIQKLPFFI